MTHEAYQTFLHHKNWEFSLKSQTKINRLSTPTGSCEKCLDKCLLSYWEQISEAEMPFFKRNVTPCGRTVTKIWQKVTFSSPHRILLWYELSPNIYKWMIKLSIQDCCKSLHLLSSVTISSANSSRKKKEVNQVIIIIICSSPS